nr:superoxide dismutase family protein [uncultured Sphingomonas sp.]
MRFSLIMAAAPLVLVAACNKAEPAPEMNNAEIAMDENAIVPAPMVPFMGGDGTTLGNVSVEDSPGGLVVTLAGAGMPAGVHGIHLHAVGKCEGPKFESAGGHWNPASKMHGSENPAGPHMGDLPNVTVAEDGSLSQSMTVSGVTLAQLQDADGTALVIHAKADDNKTDPSGNSGDRIACAVLAPAPTGN